MDELMTEAPEANIYDYDSSFRVSTGDVCDHSDEWISLDVLKAGANNFAGMVTRSSPSRVLINSIRRLAPYLETVLIQGESGTGKELVARALHTLGPRPNGPLVTLNCSNLLGSLAEAQLFGHVRGAFTDAREDSLGYFRSANGGTLFLDEVGELPLQLQPKLLRVVETHEVQPVGSTKTYRADVRLVAATNRDLSSMIKSGEFRQDLYYRLNALNIQLPTLRERCHDIGALTAHFIERGNKLFDKRVRLISQRALDLIVSSVWPGNIRELVNTVQGAVILSADDRLCVKDFPHLQKKKCQVKSESASGSDEDVDGEAEGEDAELSLEDPNEATSLKDITHQAVKKALARALQEAGGNCARAARILGVSRYTVYRLAARYGLALRQKAEDQ
jgi:transcriptional regulator with GAF, ATPase, and Fis domain